ncbi:hypothetical protein BH20ACI3_BH20ACI3_20930 [soil metagenome]
MCVDGALVVRILRKGFLKSLLNGRAIAPEHPFAELSLGLRVLTSGNWSHHPRKSHLVQGPSTILADDADSRLRLRMNRLRNLQQGESYDSA